MDYSYSVDWGKTCENISFRLEGRARKKDFAPIFHICERAVQKKLARNPLSIEELATIARFLGCDILDLLVFESDNYVPPQSYKLSKKDPVEHSTSEEILNCIRFHEELESSYEIVNLYEFLLYLPMIQQERLEDVLWRINGDFVDGRRDYIREQLNYLHRTIAEGPAKQYADNYRNNVLRAKGDCRHADVEGDSLTYMYELARFAESWRPANNRPLTAGIKQMMDHREIT